MKWYKKLLSEVAQPTSEDEINFKEKHIIDHILDPNAEEHQFTADEIKKFKNRADYEKGEDIDVYEDVDLVRDLPGQEDDDVNNDGKVDNVDKHLKYKRHAEIKSKIIDESVKVEKQNYKWGKFINIEDGHSISYPMHPEHQKIVKNIKDGETNTYKDEQGKHVTVSRNGNKLSFTAGIHRSTPTVVDRSHFLDENSSFKSLVTRLVNKKLQSEGLEPVTPVGGDFDEDESHQNYKKGNMSTKLPAIGDNLNQEGVDLKKDKKGLKVFVEAYSRGSLKLSDNSSVSLTNEDAKVLNSLFNGLNDKNKTKMENTLKSDKKGFNEILSFAKETYNG